MAKKSVKLPNNLISKALRDFGQRTQEHGEKNTRQGQEVRTIKPEGSNHRLHPDFPIGLDPGPVPANFSVLLGQLTP